MLSVVVIIASDTTSAPDVMHLRSCLQALREQERCPPMEIIAPVLTATRGLAELKREYPGVRFLEFDGTGSGAPRAGGREHHDELRSEGIKAAAGGIIALIEDHDCPAPDWAAEVVRAHAHPAAAIGGAVENGIRAPLNWAVYFCDFGRYQNPIPEGESRWATDVNVSYKRAALEKVRPAWESSFHEIRVHRALMQAGEQVRLCPRMVVFQRRRGLRLKGCLRERYVWGRSFAASRAREMGVAGRAALAALSPALPLLLLARMGWRAARKGALGAFAMAFPLTAALTVAWGFGEMAGYASGRAIAARELKQCASA